MSRRRVVITGLGLVCPVGNSVAEGWANLLAGKSGIDNITRFDASAFACKFAGEVKGFNVEDYIPGKEAGAIVDLKRVTACRVDINARNDGNACLDEAVGQPSRATEKINARDVFHFTPLWATRLLSRQT